MVHGCSVCFYYGFEVNEEIYLRVRLNFLKEKNNYSSFIHEINFNKYILGNSYPNIRYKYYYEESLIPKNNLVKYHHTFKDPLDNVVDDLLNFLESFEDKCSLDSVLGFIKVLVEKNKIKEPYENYFYKTSLAIEHSLIPYLNRIKDSENNIDVRLFTKFLKRKNKETEKETEDEDDFNWRKNYPKEILKLTDDQYYGTVAPFILTQEEIDQIFKEPQTFEDYKGMLTIKEFVSSIDPIIDTNSRIYGHKYSY
jgi:hypothetical protein